ncbi:MAG: hypothetical protein JWM12_3786, partial [Ilumatobacteraceae bacterium]|nr:hypothetical protein [Ilumatobacteraceae bacterium]
MSTNTAPSSLTRIHQGVEIPLPGVYELDGAQSKVGFEASTHIDRE